MNKLLCSALALPLTAVAGWASDDDWANLDLMAEELAANLENGTTGPNLGGYLITNYWNSSDRELRQSPSGNDLSGFALPYAVANISGNQGDWAYFVEYNFAGVTSDTSNLLGTAALGDIGGEALRDAHVRIPITGAVYAQVGRQRAPVLHNSHVYRPNLFFSDRTLASKIFARRDEGIVVGGNMDVFDWRVAVLNGADEAGSDYSLSARVEARVLGDGIGLLEGSHNGTDAPSGTVGLAIWKDDGIKKGDPAADEVIAADFHVATNVYSAGIEILDIGGDKGDILVGSGGTGGNTFPLLIPLEGDTNPITVQATYAIIPDEVEAGARYAKVDNTRDNKVLEVGVRKYFDGHRANVGAFYRRYDGDSLFGDDSNDFNLFGVELRVAF